MAHKQDKDRVGDVLGLGDIANVPAGSDETVIGRNRQADETHRRRHRMSEGADELTPDATAPDHGGSGATGIDMGSGGEGTDLE